MNAENINIIILLSVSILVLVTTVAAIFVFLKRRKKREIREKFKRFTESHNLSKKDMRAVPRILIPESFDVVLSLTETDYFGLKSRVKDMSLSAFAAKPDFHLKRLPLNSFLKNVLIVTPINSFVIKEMNTIRVDDRYEKKVVVFKIINIEADQFEELKRFMAYLDKFLKW